MPRYEVVGVPLGPSPVAGRKLGDVVDLELDKDAEKAWTGAGAVRRLAAKEQPKKNEPEDEFLGKETPAKKEATRAPKRDS